MAEIYENMINDNTSMISKTENTIPSTYSVFESPVVSPPSITPAQSKTLRFIPNAECFTTPTNVRTLINQEQLRSAA